MATNLSKAVSAEHIHHLCHELRGPLSSTLAFAELLLDGAADPQSTRLREGLDTILRNSLRLGQIIDDLEAITAPAAPLACLPTSAVDLVALCRRLLEEATRTLRTRSIPVSIESPEELWVEGLDEKLLGAALRWLICRRLACSSHRDGVVMCLDRRGSQVCLSIAAQVDAVPASSEGRGLLTPDVGPFRSQRRRMSLDLLLVSGALDGLGGSVSGELLADGSPMFHVELPSHPASTGIPHTPDPVIQSG